MQRKVYVPEYFVYKRNLFIQILFTTIFVYAFINIYKPFGVSTWYDVDIWRFRFYSLLIVLSGMLIVIISRIILYQIGRKHRIGVFSYGISISLEILLMSIFYALLGYFVPEHNTHSFISLVFLSIYNSVLILLIPYLLTLLYFAWAENRNYIQDIKTNINTTYDSNKHHFIPLHDENNVLRITLKKSDLYYISANDNYVVVHYLMSGIAKQFLLRSTLKKLEAPLSHFQIVRCHRSFMVNLDKISVITKTKKGLSLAFDSNMTETIHVSPTYLDKFKSLYNPNIKSP